MTTCSRPTYSLERMRETIVCTLNISNSFADFVDKFDHDEAPGRQAKGIQVLYRGVAKDNPSEVVIVVQAEAGVIAKHMQDNAARFVENGALVHTAMVTSYNES